MSEFPDVAKKMRIYYRIIANLLEILDDKEHLSEESFDYAEEHIKKQMNALDDCLADIFRDDIEVDRLNRLERYYHTVRNDAMECLINKLDPSAFDINARLQDIFNALSATIRSLEYYPCSQRYLTEYYNHMKSIKDILESPKYEEQLTIFQYHSRGKKYRDAFAYVKKIRSGT